MRPCYALQHRNFTVELPVQQLTSNVFVETGVKGCNFGYVMTSDGIVLGLNR